MLDNPPLSTVRARITLSERWIALALIIATAVLVIAGLFFLTAYPPVFIDEPWYSNAAWNLVTKGSNFDSMFTGALDQWEPAWVRWPFIGNLPLAAAFAVGGLGLFQARLTSWIIGIMLLGLVFALGRRLYSTLTGALATFLLALSYVFFQASHYARVDIFLACAVAAALYLFVVGVQDNKRWAFFLSGLVSTLSVDIHMNGALFTMSLALLFGVVYKRKVLRSRNIWYFATGVVLGVLYYLVLHVAPNPATYFQISRGWQGSMMQPPLATLNLLVIIESLLNEIGRYHFYEYGLDFALIGASFLFLAMRRTFADRLMLAFVSAAFLLFVLFVQNKHDIYAVLFYPYFLLMAAEALISLAREGRKRGPQRAFIVALLALFVLNSAIHIVRPVIANRGYDYYAVTERIKSAVPAEARIAGLPNWWLGLADYDYRSIMNLTYYHFFNGYTLLQGLEAIRPQYLIVDTGLQGLLVDEGYFPSGPGFAMYRLPREEFEIFLSERGTKVEEFVDPWHGEFQIYQIRWD